jgi:DNA-binding sugar fermentation-stimulating protein
MLIAGAMMMFACEVSSFEALSKDKTLDPRFSEAHFHAFQKKLIVACVGTFTSAHNEASQKVLVAFSCIFIGIFAATWGEKPFPSYPFSANR